MTTVITGMDCPGWCRPNSTCVRTAPYCRCRPCPSDPDAKNVLSLFSLPTYHLFMSAKPVLARGRASRSNASGRFEALTRDSIDDGWGEDPRPDRLETEMNAAEARVTISRNDSPDIGFDPSINPYRGCEHGCIYCFARPNLADRGRDPGLDFE